MLARCGRVAHICEANQILQSVFPVAIAFFETVKFAILWFIRNELQIRTRQRGNCSTLAGKSRGGTPFCRMWKTGFPRSIVSKQQAAGNWKFFGAAVFQKCCRGVGEQPTFAKQIGFCNFVFLLQLHVLKLSNSNKVVSWESRLQIRTRQRGNCSMLAGKSRGGTPFCRMLQIGFSKSFLALFHVKCCS